MQANRSRDTKPELAVRRLLHARGFRYRVAVAPVAGLRRRADIVFAKQRIAVFIDGCFWHGCTEHGRKSFQHNVDYWPAKIATNMARDLDTTARLSEFRVACNALLGARVAQRSRVGDRGRRRRRTAAPKAWSIVTTP